MVKKPLPPEQPEILGPLSNAAWLLRRYLDSKSPAPSITVTICVPSDQTPGQWRPALTCWGWGINGTVIQSVSGVPLGIEFSTVSFSFSDRVVNSGASPIDYQRFSSSGVETVRNFRLEINNGVVVATGVLRNWNNDQWSAETWLIDKSGLQLLFMPVQAIRGAIRETRSVMLISLQPAGKFGFL